MYECFYSRKTVGAMTHSTLPCGVKLGLLVLLFLLSAWQSSLEAQQADNLLGVSSCAAAACHGSAIPRAETRILRNEYRTWLENDPHSDAYDVLLTASSRQIVANMQRFGSPIESAHTSAVCLDCHATISSPADPTEGVSCESCHGPAGNWIVRHDEVATLEERAELGMTPTWEPERRADICLSCHLGTGGRFVTHEIMAAGHPRLAFELETFTYRQPAHFRHGDDALAYSARKPQSAESASVWAIGQGVYLRNYASLLSSSFPDSGWPEFAQFDCFSCHRAVDRDSDVPERPLARPGIPNLNRSSTLLFREVIAVLDPTHLENFDASLDGLYKAVAQPGAGLRPAAENVAETVEAEVGHVAAREWSEEDLEAVLGRLVSPRLAADYRTYADAEQLTMAVQALMSELERQNGRTTPRIESMDFLTALFNATEDELSFKIGEFRQVLADFRQSLPE
jgi:hypothetical protein